MDAGSDFAAGGETPKVVGQTTTDTDAETTVPVGTVAAVVAGAVGSVVVVVGAGGESGITLTSSPTMYDPGTGP
jgi:hypothetical protein